ncbi:MULTISPECIES: CBS domain-containing protein [Bradyrhizobium]|jgi:CBS domain-containing protein|uniref:CBS domain-containing protein n=1 Tax=Bradyrhizobium elkanii TaxID=29448 RepID=A0A8I1Y7K5_BRAEL|nr:MULTISPECIES: CBS domain-containing protein [Bradyrhizobium]MBP1293745.1 CBS domain-containing protein [Bradyrhizobium elkanii]MCP1925671.1 CBS domain-containing protein [Bradyrhizobium elkanii]MCS3451308.1 CBS domain-containing protein [Bradyrhizobium elkanii]MCS3477013.1 CBS domain-containing protein [Bradyrhizobium elkanii]MCS3566667.1 CBS domain-containing protein [Bradyrhizobium elkanii]
MLATDVMRSSFATIKPTATVLNAVELLLETDQRGLPVIDDAGELVGMVSEGDFLHRDELDISPPSGNWLESLLGIVENTSERERMRTLQVGSLMSGLPITVDIEASIEDVVAQMDVYNVAQIPVLCARTVVGIVSRRELLAALARRLRDAEKASTGVTS